MKFQLRREALLPALQSAVRVSTKGPQETFEHVLLRIDGDGSELSMTASDGQCTLQTTVPVDTETPGKMLLPAAKLLSICRLAPAGATLAFQMLDAKVEVVVAGSRFNLSSLDPERFPLPNSSTDAACQLEIPANALLELFERTSCCISSNDFRQYLKGTLLHLKKDALIAVATDTHRLAWVQWQGDFKISQDIQAIVPQKAVAEMVYILNHSASSTDKDGAPLCQVVFQEQSVLFKIGRQELQSVLISGTYPDYERVLPDRSTARTLMIDVEQLKAALQRVEVIAGKDGAISWEVAKDRIQLKTTNQIGEEAEDSLSVNFDGQEARIGFNVSYQLAILENISGPLVEYALRSDADSVDIRDPERDDLRYVLMPLRL
ncbi:MAG: DNA polymerase III subunit beta [Gammaproteobacteria bacterium]